MNFDNHRLLINSHKFILSIGKMNHIAFLCLILCMGMQYAAGGDSGYEYVREANAWLRLHTESASWAEAGMRCYLEGAVLASPTSNDMAQAMTAILFRDPQLGGSAYTGINAILSREQFKTLEGVPLSSIPVGWAPGQPDNADSDEDCLALTGAGALADVNCDGPLPYFCRKQHANDSTPVLPHACSSCMQTAAGGDSNYEYVREVDAWLRLHIVPASWADAGMRCYLEGGVLVSPTTLAMAKAMVAIMDKQQQRALRVFTGINSILSTNNLKSLEGVPLASIPVRWAPGEPDNATSDEECVALTSAGFLADVSCGRPLPYICRKENVLRDDNHQSAIKHGYQWEARTGSYYKFHRDAENWETALDVCRAEGGHLVIINSKTEQAVVREMFNLNPRNTINRAYSDASFVAIGFRKWDDGKWGTIFGETLSKAGFDEWGPGEPNSHRFLDENCGSFSRQGQLNDIPCSGIFTYAFICEINS